MIAFAIVTFTITAFANILFAVMPGKTVLRPANRARLVPAISLVRVWCAK